MRFIYIFIVILFLSINISYAKSNPNVAFVYSDYRLETFKTEFDDHFKYLGWSFDKYNNKDIEKLNTKLDEYNIIVFGGVANIENTFHMKDYANKWIKWLDNGGILILTDANYDHITTNILSELGEDFSLKSSACINSKIPENKRDDIILNFPNDIKGIRSGLWAHLFQVNPSYRSVIDCGDGKIAVYKQVNNGIVFVTSYFRYGGEGQNGKVLLQNIWAKHCEIKNTCMINYFDIKDFYIGNNKVLVNVANPTKNNIPCNIKVSVFSNNKLINESSKVITASKKSITNLNIPIYINTRGNLNVIVSLLSNKNTSISEKTFEVSKPLVVNNKRDFYYKEIIKTGKLELKLTPDDKLSSYKINIYCDNILNSTYIPKIRDEIIKYNISRLSVGEHKIKIEFLNNKNKYIEETKIYIYPKPNVYVDKAGFIVKNNKRIFPIGFYHVSWPYTIEDRIKCMKEIKAAGFNTFHAGITDLEEYKLLLDEAEKLNMYLITEFMPGTDPRIAIDKYKGKPAEIIWDCYDEPNAWDIKPSELKKVRDNVKAIDSSIPTFLTLAGQANSDKFKYCSDVHTERNLYPLTKNGGSCTDVYNEIKLAYKNVGDDHIGIWSALQAYVFPHIADSYLPTYEELRNMTYLAILAKTRGILYYVWKDPYFYMPDYKDLYNKLPTLTKELKKYEFYFLNGKYTESNPKNKLVFAGYWQIDNKVLYIIVNGDKNIEKVTVTDKYLINRLKLKQFNLMPLEVKIIELNVKSGKN